MRAIQFEHVSKQFPRAPRPAVDDVTLGVAAGELVVLLGPSGCGKTTVLKMVNRLYEPTGGRIYLDDTEIHQLEVNALRRQIGYVIQQIGLFPHMTVAQNIAVVPQLLGWRRDRIAARVDDLFDLVDLPPTEYRARYPAQLSGDARDCDDRPDPLPQAARRHLRPPVPGRVAEHPLRAGERLRDASRNTCPRLPTTAHQQCAALDAALAGRDIYFHARP